MARDLEVRLSVAGVPASRVTRFQATHDAAQPGVVHAEVVFADTFDLGAMVGKRAVLAFGAAGDEMSRLAGVVEEAAIEGTAQRGADDRGTRYALTIASPLALLRRSVSSRIFQDKTVKDIVTEVLADHGITGVDWRLGNGYPKRECCVQYQESALAFVSRLIEHEGIYFYFEPSDDGERLVFADDSTVAPRIRGVPGLPLRRRTGLVEVDDAVYALHERQEVRSGKFVLRDFDFKRPRLDLTATAQADTRADLEVYDYPGCYVEPGDGQRLAQVRLEAEQVERHTFEIEALCPRIAAGHRLKIVDAGEADGEYFVCAATHAYEHQDGEPRYRCRARLIPSSVKYRPPRLTLIPRIEGPQTATVVAPAGSPVETIHTDEHGRCKVKFHWDRSDALDDKASCWIRVTQPQTSGSMMLPRIGWEVMVEFLEGDPDRPLVTGLLYNGANMPPYVLPEGKTRTALKTRSSPGGGGTNEIRFEDKAGSEELMMHAQHNMKTAAANNASKSVGGNSTSVVGGNATLTIGGDQTTKITKGSSNTVSGSQTVSVGGNRSVEVNAVAALTSKGGASTSVGGNQFEMDGNPLKALLALAAEKAEEFAKAMADNAVAAVQAHVDRAVNQAMGPINDLQAKVQGVQSVMQAVANGDLSGIAGMAASASGLPGPGAFASSMSGGGGQGGGAAPGGGPPTGAGGGGPGGANGAAGQTSAIAAMAQSAAHDAIHQGMGAAAGALGQALGLDGAGGGGGSGANMAGPAGDVAGVDATDRETGPGHSISKVGGSSAETVGSIKVLGALQTINTNVAADASLNVGAATLQLAVGNHAETVGGAKTEKALGLVVLTKGGESEQVGATKMVMVGGAVVDKLKGSHVVAAGGPATFIGAFHKVEAKTAVVFKCGSSELVVGPGGVTISSPMVAILAPKIVLPKKVTEL